MHVMSPQQGLQITSVAPIADDEWVNVHGVGEYQRVLAGMVPCTVQVELFPWDREERVTARVNGQRVGELSDGFAGKVHAVLHARRVTGLAPIIVEGEVRRGDYLPIYLAVRIPHWGRLAAWIESVAPTSWRPRRPAEVPARLHKLGQHQEALVRLFAKYGSRTRGVPAVIRFQPAPTSKYAGQTMGFVSIDEIVFAELNAPAEGSWSDVLADYEAGPAHDVPRWRNSELIEGNFGQLVLSGQP
jgi:hypothetical protein